MKNTNLILIGIVVLVVIGGGAYYAMSMNKTGTPGSSFMNGSEPSGNADNSKDEVTASAASLEVKGAYTVVATNFSYDVKQMKVKKGVPVTVTFKNSEGYHDWNLDEFNAHSQKIQSGQEEVVTFTPDKVGTFEYYCSVGNHRQMGMTGVVVVEE